MLFHVTWQFIDVSEEGRRQSLKAFEAWQPPAEADFKGFFGFADGTGGVAIIEVDSAETLARTIAPWTGWLQFETTAILPIEESSRISNEALAWVESVA
jgi:hypothetical protein